MNAHTKNIVFDWNSTLLDDIHAMHECTNILLKSEGYEPIAIDHFRDHYNVPFDQFYRGMGFKEAEVEKLMSLENSTFHDHYEPLAHKADLREGALEVLTEAREAGIQSLILSNHLVDPIRMQLRRLAIDTFFAEVLAYADRATQFRDMTKGERLRRFIEARGMTPSHTMIVGDSVEEIHIAKEQGLISIAITGGCVSEQRLRAEDPDYLIHTLHDLKPIMREQGFVSKELIS